MRTPITTSLLLLAASASLLACAQQRTISITSEPAGAAVTLNDIEVGRTPVEVDFTWFGVYDVRLTKPGYEPLITTAEAEPRLHDQPGLDLLAAFIPGGTETIIDWHFTLTPQPTNPSINQQSLINNALQTRQTLTTTPPPPTSEPATK